jgi:hypothetical protein
MTMFMAFIDVELTHQATGGLLVLIGITSEC